MEEEKLDVEAAKKSHQKRGALPSLLETLNRHKDYVAELGDAALKFDLADLTKETAVNLEVMESVPILKYFAKAYSVKELYQQIRLQRNCEAFLKAVQAVDNTNIQKLADIFEKNPDALDTLLSVLFDSAKPLKAEIMGNLVQAVTTGAISADDFDELSLLLLSASIPALRALKDFFEKTSDGSHYTVKPHVVGEPLLFSLGVCARHGNKFEISRLGYVLNKFGMRGKSRSMPPKH